MTRSNVYRCDRCKIEGRIAADFVEIQIYFNERRFSPYWRRWEFDHLCEKCFKELGAFLDSPLSQITAEP